MQVELEPVYILHTRPYRDTSLLVDFFSLRFGRISCVARGVRKSKSPKRNLLNPFHRLLVSFQGKSDLKLLTQFESAEPAVPLEEKYLFSGFYINELIMRLLPEQDTSESLFVAYEQCLKNLGRRLPLEPTLRRFELDLLRDLGYAVSFESDAASHQNIESKQSYYLDVNQGFINFKSYENENNFYRAELMQTKLFSGAEIIAIGQFDLSDAQVLKAAKKITRLLLDPLLGKKPLVSRELFTR